jgi:hypothetical protein
MLLALLAASLTAPPSIPTPAWIENEPLVIAGNWDSMPIFRRRVGGNTLWQEQDYRREMSEDAVRKLKEAGVTMVVTHFYKGFGLAAEKPHIDDARRYAELLHRYGIRVGVYIGSTVAYETFLAEVPEAEQWFVPDYMGRPVFYDDQTFRKRVYFMHPGYRAYMKRVLRLAVVELHADEIDFDNTSMQAHPQIFQHPLAVRDFREWLRGRYTPEELTRRLGFSATEHILPPRYDKPLGAIGDPLFEEWADFRCHQLNSYYAELAAFIRGLNPNVAIATNPHSGISGRNTVWDQGVDYPTLLPSMDITWTEEGNPAGVDADGVLVSKIRTYKMATSLGRRVLTYTAGEGGGKLQMAESMAYNRQTLGMVGGALAGYQLGEPERRYIRFFKEHFDMFRGVRNVADVAVLHSHASMGFDNDLPWQSSMLVEQALIQANVPFDIVFDEQLANLARYKALVLPDQECLSDGHVELVRKYAAAGGGLVATEKTALFNEWREERRESALKGTGIWIAAVEPRIPKPSGAPMISRYWKLPLNAAEIVAAVRKAARGDMALQVTAPPYVVSEILENGSGALFVHLLNYGKAATGAIALSVRIPSGRAPASLALLSPDGGAANLSYETGGGRLRVRVPRVETYSIVAVNWK